MLQFSWSAIFFYAYTSRIAFSTISSPGATAGCQEEEMQDDLSSIEPAPPQEPETASHPPTSAAVVEPCSPKSIYALASKVRSVCVLLW